MCLYKGKDGTFMTCVWGYEWHILKLQKFRNIPSNWFCIKKHTSNLLYMLDKCKNWKIE